MAEISKPKPKPQPQPPAPLGWDQQHPFWAKALDNFILPAYNAKVLPVYNKAFTQAAANEDQMAQQALDQGSRVRSLYHDSMKVMDKIGAGITGVKVVETPLFLAPPVAAGYYGTLGTMDLAKSLPQVRKGDPEAIQNFLLTGAGMAAMGVDSARIGAEEFNPTDFQPLPFQKDVESLAKQYTVLNTANKLRTLTNANGGATYSLTNGNLAGKDAFSVAAFPEKGQVIQGTPGFRDYYSYVNKNYQILQHPATAVGTWKNNGQTYIDISGTPSDLNVARQLGQQLNQKAIYDLKYNREIPTGGDGTVPAQAPSIDSRLDALKQDAPALNANHWSQNPNLTTLDPQYFGSATDVTGAERQRASDPDFQKRVYLGINGKYREPQVQGRPFRYGAQVNSSRYYDIANDPQGFWENAANPTQGENALKNAGYSGYKFDGVLASFDPVNVQGGPNQLSFGVKPKADPFLTGMVSQYNKAHGLPPVQMPNQIGADTRAPEIATAYEQLQHNPSDPRVQAAYGALKKDVTDQWNFATNQGFQFEPWTQEGQPYANSKEMMQDVQNNKHLYYFPGGDIPADHPLAEVNPATGETYNNMFRAVHDLFGHAQYGFQFGPAGEEGAWLTHSQMMSPNARAALTTETKGQNSWVNFGPQIQFNNRFPIEGEPGFVPQTQRPFAQQKAGLLPQDFWTRAMQQEAGVAAPTAPNFVENILQHAINSPVGKRLTPYFGLTTPQFAPTSRQPLENDLYTFPILPVAHHPTPQYNPTDNLNENLKNYGTYLPPTGYSDGVNEQQAFNPFLF